SRAPGAFAKSETTARAGSSPRRASSCSEWGRSSDRARLFAWVRLVVGGVKVSAGALLLGIVFGAAPALAAPKLEPPRRLDAAAVPYPTGAHGDASVELTLVVEADGTVADVRVERGEPPFAAAAELGVKHFRFAPATRDDLPIAARISALVEFHEPPPPAR